MINRTTAYSNNRINPYLQTQQAPPVQPQAATPQVATAQPMAAPLAQGALSTEEQQLIDRYFPASSSMSMRLYGPGRDAQTVTPAVLGSRLDLRG